MKKTLLLVFLTFMSFAQETPDLLIRTKLDHKRSDGILKKIKTFMLNNELGDFSNMKFEERWVVDESILADHFDEDSKKIVNEISGFLPFDVSNTRIEIAVEGVSYKIKNLSLAMRSNEDNYKAEFRASGACATIDRIGITLKVPMVGDLFLPTYAPSLDNAMLLIGNITKEECLSNKDIDNNDEFKPIAFDVDLKTTFTEKTIAFNILKTSFEKIKDLVLNQRDLIKLEGITKENLNVEDVIVEFGSKDIIFYGDKVKDVILQFKNSYTNLLLDQLAKMIEEGHMDRTVEALDKLEIDKGYWVDSTDYQTFLSIDHIVKTDKEDEIVGVVSSGFCVNKEYNKHGENCLEQNQLYYEFENTNSIQESIDFMGDLMDKNNASVVASASENYINKIIDLTFKAGYWEAEFNTDDMEIGPAGGFVKLNKEGTKATFYLQLKYNAKKFHKFLIGAKKFDLLIPVKCEVSLKIVKKGNVPVMQFIVESVDTSEDFLWYGDQYMSSSFGKVKRFKKIIRNKFILPEVESYIGKSAFEVEFPEVRDMNIDQLKLYIDGQGRAHAMLD